MHADQNSFCSERIFRFRVKTQLSFKHPHSTLFERKADSHIIISCMMHFQLNSHSPYLVQFQWMVFIKRQPLFCHHSHFLWWCMHYGFTFSSKNPDRLAHSPFYRGILKEKSLLQVGNLPVFSSHPHPPFLPSLLQVDIHKVITIM